MEFKDGRNRERFQGLLAQFHARDCLELYMYEGAELAAYSHSRGPDGYDGVAYYQLLRVLKIVEGFHRVSGGLHKTRDARLNNILGFLRPLGAPPTEI